MTRTIAQVLTLGSATLAMACANPGPASSTFPAGVLVDLSHSYDGRTLYWPTSETFRLEKVADGMTPGGYYYAANNLFTAEHGGTHIDAPVHFAAARLTVDQIPLERLAGPAVVVDVSDRSEANADYQVTTEDLMQWESVHGAIPPEAILLLRTGFSQRWPDALRYLGTAERGSEAVAKLRFPGLHPDAARWLTASRPVRAIGIDTASIDFGQSTGFEAHRVLFEHDIPALENLTALDRLPPVGAFVIALPMKIAGGSGAPLRAVAVVPAKR
jgi:kynurenine formamidase